MQELLDQVAITLNNRFKSLEERISILEKENRKYKEEAIAKDKAMMDIIEVLMNPDVNSMKVGDTFYCKVLNTKDEIAHIGEDLIKFRYGFTPQSKRQYQRNKKLTLPFLRDCENFKSWWEWMDKAEREL